MSTATILAEVRDFSSAAHPMTLTAPNDHHPVTLMTMIDRAVAGGNLELVERMMTLQERWERNEAVKAFNTALAAAKSKIKPIMKNREVDFEGKSSGARTNYRYEDLAAIAEEIDPILGENNLFYRWKVNNANGKVVVTCVLSHGSGYSEETTLEAGVDVSGNKNAIQGIGSSATFLQRYTLKAALGLSVSNDDDGRSHAAPASAERPKPPKPGSTEAKTLDAPRMITGTGPTAENWADAFIKAIENATLAETTKWIEINKDILAKLEAFPDVNAKVAAAINARAPKPPKPPKPGAQVEQQQVAATVAATPSLTTDPAGWLKWLGAKMDGFGTHEAGEAYWNDHIDPLDLPRDVQEDAMGIWNRFEDRHAP